MKRSNSNMTLLIEVVGCVVLVLLMSWSSVPSTVAIVAEMYAVYLRELFVFRFSTHSVFLIGNLIIIVLVVQSTKLTEKTTLAQKVRFAPHQFDIVEQKIKSSPPSYSIGDRIMKPDPRDCMTDEQMKSRLQVQSRDFLGPQATINKSSKEDRSVPMEVSEKVNTVKPESSQLYRRTMSASYERGGAKVKMTGPELVRSKTVRRGTREKSTMVAGRFDELNHDEFRRKIESFIEKQRRLIREELVVARLDGHGFSPWEIVKETKYVWLHKRR